MKVCKIGARQLQILRKVSEGGSATVYLVAALDGSDRRFALKTIKAQSEEQLAAARRELSFLQTHCQSGNRCFVGFEGGAVEPEGDDLWNVSILFEYCPNGTLFDLMAARQSSASPLTETEILRLLRLAAKCLSALHSVGFAHYDVKLENFLFFDWNTLKLCDFGSASTLAVDFAATESAEYYRYEALFEGRTTLMYRPPEMCDPYLRYRVDAKADVWMLGCVLYALTHGRHPFLGKSKLAIATGQFGWPAAPSRPRLESIARNLLTPNPALRPAAAELLAFLDSGAAEMRLNAQAEQLKSEQRAISEQLRVGASAESDRFEFDFAAFDAKRSVPTQISELSSEKRSFDTFQSRKTVFSASIFEE